MGFITGHETEIGTIIGIALIAWTAWQAKRPAQSRAALLRAGILVLQLLRALLIGAPKPKAPSKRRKGG